jgi:hypothetical protein
MPRARQVTMGGISAQEAHAAAIKRTIKLYSPYEAVAGELVGQDQSKYCVVYRAPRGGDREVVMSTDVHSRSLRLRDRLNKAWAEGFYSSGRDQVD